MNLGPVVLPPTWSFNPTYLGTDGDCLKALPAQKTLFSLACTTSNWIYCQYTMSGLEASSRVRSNAVNEALL